jgi:hypothetical protein
MHSSLRFDKEMEDSNNLTIPEEQLDEANDKLDLGVSTSIAQRVDGQTVQNCNAHL